MAEQKRQGLITGILHFLLRRQASVVIFVPIDFDTVKKKVPVFLVKVAPSVGSSSGPLAAGSSRRRNRQMRRLLFAVNTIEFGAFENCDFGQKTGHQLEADPHGRSQQRPRYGAGDRDHAHQRTRYPILLLPISKK
jgi:hypothetical protein